MRAVGALLVLVWGTACSAPPVPQGEVRLVADGGTGGGWAFSDGEAFEWRNAAGGFELALKGPSAYRPPVRAPQAIALCLPVAWDEFTLDCELRQDGREYAHRDLCLFFGYRDPTHFGYVHMASTADDNAHGIFLVDGAPRRQVTTTRTDGVQWGGADAWHRVRLERRDGLVRVFFDDLTTPVMTADAAHFGPGFVGFGSFDDTGLMRAFTVTGVSAVRPLVPPFARP